MADAQAPAPRRRWLFIVSLCLNAFLIAALVAGAIAVQRATAGLGGSSPLLPRNAERLLEGEGREKVRALQREHRGEFLPLLRETRAARRDAYAAFRAEPFDAARFSSAMDRIRAADAALAAATQAVVLKMAQQLTSAERAELVRAGEEERRARRRGRAGPPADEQPADELP